MSRGTWTVTEWGIRYVGDPRYSDGYIETGGTTLGGRIVGRYSYEDARAIAQYSQYGTLVSRKVVKSELEFDWEEA